MAKRLLKLLLQLLLLLKHQLLLLQLLLLTQHPLLKLLLLQLLLLKPLQLLSNSDLQSVKKADESRLFFA